LGSCAGLLEKRGREVYLESHTWIRAKSKVEPWCSFAIGIRLASGNPDPLPGLRDGALFLVGDPKQAIYRFRGADVNAYVRAREAIRAANPENIVSISTNFRSQPIDDRSLISTRVARVEVQPKQLVIHLTEEPKGTGNRKKTRANGALHVPWQRALTTRRREILLPEGMPPQHTRPIRSETRATLVAAIARGRRWLDELTTDPSVTTESIAKREDCSIRKVNMTISLAFLAPNLVIAAIDGRLPHGMGVARLTDLPPEWSRQHELLHLPSH
jgi:hypothetical protein